MLKNSEDLDAELTRIRKEMNDKLTTEMAKVNQQIQDLKTTSVSSTTVTSTRPTILNLTRNGDLRDSVDSRFNSVSAADNSRYECANVYTYPFEPITITDAEIDAGTNILKALTSTPFTLQMEGRYVVIEGAGAAGAKFGAKIVTFNNSGEVILLANALTSVSNATARINLVKLTHKNTKTNPGDTVNDALKDVSHTHYGTNINDPDWQMTEGIGRLGSQHVIGFPFGYISLDDGLTYIPQHLLFSGRLVFTRVNLARANKFVKPKGRLFLGIYNNYDLALDWVRGGEFAITPKVQGEPLTTTSAKYLVIIESDSGYTLISNILTVADAPDITSFNLGASVRLNWNRFAGTRQTTVYRQIGAGNIFKLESDVFDREYTDINHPAREDMGTTSFTTIINGFSNRENKVFSYFATATGGLDNLPNNAEAESWYQLEAFLAFPPTINMAELFDPHLLLGLTEPLATEVTDAIADGAGNISSVSAAFTADMVGKSYTLRHQPTNQTATGTVSGFTDSEHIALSSSPFAASDCILEIEDSQPHGLLFDLVGTAITEESSDWGFHPEDTIVRQPSVANPPTGSNQGGIGGSDGYGGGYGGIRDCVLDDVWIDVRGISNTHIIKKRADQVLLTDLIWTGEGFADDDFNQIDWMKISYVNEICDLRTHSKHLPCTKWHRLVNSPETKKCGIAVKDLMSQNKTLISEIFSTTIETQIKFNRRSELIEKITYRKGRFRVVSFGLRGKNPNKCNLMVCNDIQSHNLKDLLLIDQFV